MTTPERPVVPPLSADQGWDDERLEAAFAARAARVGLPGDLVVSTVERLRPAARRPQWARLLPAGAALVLVLGLVGGGIAMLGGGGLLGSGTVSFRDGPTPDLRTLDGSEYALDFPATWLAYSTSANPGTGGSIDAVLTTQPIEERCGGLLGADINCVYEQRLEPGQLRIFVGSGSYRAQTVLDRADIENGTTTRLAVGGMPAILDEFDDAPDDYYLADQSATWAIATPTSLDRVIRIEFMAREPAVDAARAAAEALVASFRFTPPPTPLPDDPEAAAAAARAALDDEAASFRQGFVPAADTDGQTYLDCLPDAPGEDRVVGIDYGPGGDLGWTVLTRCRWNVVADEDVPFWRIATIYEWTAGEAFGRYREIYWIDAAGVVVARTSSGEVPPAGDPTATPTPTATPAPSIPAWGPWPPKGAEVIELTNEGGDVPARVAVVDLSGALTEVRVASVQDGDPARPDEAFFRESSGDRRYRLRWGTTICDREMTVTIDAEVTRIVIDHAPRDGCDLMGIRRELVLKFSRDIDPASVELVVNRAVLLPDETVSSAPNVPDELFGLEVIDVEEALAIQVRVGDDREIAVRGWIWRMNPATIDCLVFERTDVEDLFFGEGCRSDSLLATADALFDDAVLPLAIGQGSTGSLPFERRIEVILVGHFDDRRSSLCSPPLAPRCADVFWVDAVSLDGVLMPRDWFDPARAAPNQGPIHAHDEAWARVRGPEEGPLIALSVGQVIGLTLARMEPVTVGQIPAEIWYWHVTAYEPSSGRLRTFVIPDSVLGDYDGIVWYEVVGDEVLMTTAIID